MSAQPAKRRRITPVPVHEVDAELTVLPPPTVVLSPEKAPTDQSVEPPEQGRRIWISLDSGYDHNYRKLLNQLGVKHPKASKAATSPGMPSPPGAPMEGMLMASGPLLGQSGRKRPEMLAMERIQRRIQLEMQGAKRGLEESEDDDEEEEEEERPGDADDEGGADEDDPDGEGKDKEEEEPEEDAQDRNYYDYTADWIDDTEFIEAIQNRDARKQKIQGFYVNAGEIERVGEREPPPDGRKKRRTKATEEPANEESAANGHAASAAPASNGKAPPSEPQAVDKARKATAAAQASAPSQQQQHRFDAAATNGASAQPAAAGAGAASSLAAMAMAAAAGHSPANPASKPGDAGKAPPRSPTIPASMTAAARKEGQPSPATAASRPSHDGSAVTPPTTGALAPDMAAHVAQLKSVMNEVPADMQAGLNGWTYSKNIHDLVERLRETAMRTAPHPPHSKKKMPSDIAACLEAIVRPFYRETEAAPNTNKAKRAVWGVIMPLLAPWAAENTIKTKMQNINSRVTGAHALAHATLSGVVQSIGPNGQSRIMEPNVVKACGTFLDKCAAFYDMSLDDPRAQDEIWDRTVHLIEEKGGPVLSVEVLRQIYKRFKDE